MAGIFYTRYTAEPSVPPLPLRRYDPMMFILKGNVPRVTLRYVEAVVMLTFALVTLFFVSSTTS